MVLGKWWYLAIKIALECYYDGWIKIHVIYAITYNLTTINKANLHKKIKYYTKNITQLVEFTQQMKYHWLEHNTWVIQINKKQQK